MGMRLDKYLKVSHLIKRRTMAKDYIDAGYVKVNGKVAKPSTDIKIGDEIEISSTSGEVTKVTVMMTKNFCNLSDAASMYKFPDDLGSGNGKK